MAFLGGLALLGASEQALTNLNSQQAIAQAHMKAAQQAQTSLDLGTALAVLNGGTTMLPEVTGGGPPPGTVGGGLGGLPGAAGAPPPGAQGPSGAAPIAAGGPPAQQPAAQIANMPQQQQGAQPQVPPGQNGAPSFAPAQQQPQQAPQQQPQQTPNQVVGGAFQALGPQQQGVQTQARPVKTVPVRGKLYDYAPEDAAQLQTQTPIEERKRAREGLTKQAQASSVEQAQQIIRQTPYANDPERVKRVMPGLVKLLEGLRQHQQQEQRYQRHEKRMERQFDIQDEERRQARQDKLKKEAEDREIKTGKIADEKREVETLAGGLRKTGGEYSTSIKDIPKTLLAKVQARAQEMGVNFRQAESEQRKQDAYDAAVGRVGATLSQRVEFSARELAQAIPQVRETSAALPRGEFVPYNQIKQYFGKAVGDEKLNDHVIALQTARNAYARAMNPMGVPRVSEAAQLRFDNIMTSALGPKALEVQLERLWKEARQMQRAASAMVPGSAEFGQPIPDLPSDPNKEVGFGGGATPASQTEGGAQSIPKEAASKLSEGMATTFQNGQVWTLENGQPKRIK